MELFAATAPGLETIALGELNRLGIKGKVEAGGVSFRGDAEAMYSTNLWLRTAGRIIVRLARFHASTFHELERRAKNVAWAPFIPPEGTVRVRVTCRKSRLYHSDAVAERVLAAISKAVPGTVRFPQGGASETDDDSDVEDGGQLFIVRIVDDECEISADTSGELLHRRGYRQEIAKAPLRETLAAAMLLASGWKPTEPLIDQLGFVSLHTPVGAADGPSLLPPNHDVEALPLALWSVATGWLPPRISLDSQAPS